MHAMLVRVLALPALLNGNHLACCAVNYGAAPVTREGGQPGYAGRREKLEGAWEPKSVTAALRTARSGIGGTFAPRSPEQMCPAATSHFIIERDEPFSLCRARPESHRMVAQPSRFGFCFLGAALRAHRARSASASGPAPPDQH